MHDGRLPTIASTEAKPLIEIDLSRMPYAMVDGFIATVVDFPFEHYPVEFLLLIFPYGIDAFNAAPMDSAVGYRVNGTTELLCASLEGRKMRFGDFLE